MAGTAAMPVKKPAGKRARAPRVVRGKVPVEATAVSKMETDEERLDRLLVGIKARAPVITAQINALLARVGLEPMS